ncbi:TPA: hypothetical protein PWY77_002483, partial [Mannheimia haemolytica]|nr:hypothetical protein [Mannheimia haemolytica]HDL1387430.1 hypothetical protein [Mannheimia haemolytica]HDL1389718.1 hypothetical protein [Mannheimia haemolytica]HDL1392011.1 hypothetical protein [Mannheimia haemolytica]HDL1394299.1 hypothetical protein [Mannheimia haemolytica]
ESVTVGDNLAVQQDKNNNTGGKNYHVTLNNTLNLGNDGSVTIGDTVINQNGLTINNGGPSVTTIGINAGNKVITNVADGQNDTDAVNLRQLKAVQTKVEKGTNVASVTANKDATGVTTYTINADGTTASADEASKDFLTVTTGEKNQDNVTDYKVGLTKKATDALAKAETAIQEFTTSVNGQTVETINKDNKDVGFVNGKGTIARNDNSNITFDVDVDDNTIKVGEDGKLTVNKEAVDTNTYVTGGTVVYADNGDATTTLNKNDGSSVTVTGIKNNFVNKAETSTDGKTATLTRNDGGTVNIDLTNTVNTAVNEATEKGFKISADKGDEDHVKLGETVKYTSTDKNIITTVTNNQIDFALNSTLAIGGKDGKSGIGLDGTNGTIGLTGPAGKDGKSATANITVKNGQPGVDGQDGETKTRIVYDGEEVATLNDGLKFGANTGDVHNAKLNTQVNVKGAEDNTEWNKFDAGQNIMTQISGNNITVALAKNVNLTEDGSVTIGGTNITNEGITINNGPKITNKEGSVSVANQDGSPTKITNVKAGDVNNTSTDAVNGSQLYTVQEIANAGWNLTINEGQNSSNVKPKETVDLNNKDGNIQITKDAHNVTFALNNELTIGGPGKNGADGKDGSIGVKGADGSTGVALNGKDGSIGINGKDGANANITVKNGKPGVDGVDGTTKTRIVYETKDGPEEVATLNDGLKFVGDDDQVITKKLNQTLNVTGGADLTKLADNNIGVVNTNNGLVVKLSKDVNLTKDGSVTIGNTTLNDSGLTIANGPSVTNTGISAGNKQITNVSSGLTNANGEKTDLANATTTNAVNVGDLKDTVNNLTNATTGGFGLTGDDKNTEVKQDLGKTIQVKGKDGVTVTANVAEKALEIVLAGDVSVSGKDGKDGSIGVKGTDGKDGVTINGNGTVVVGKDGAPGKIGINGKDGANATMTVEKGAPGLDGAKGKDGKDGTQTTRIVYTNETGGKEEVATLNDGLRFTGNNEVENKHKLNSLVTIIGEGVNKEQSGAFQSAAGNINVVADGNGNLTVKLAKNLNLTDSGSVTIGGTNITNEGITINNGPKITNDGDNVKVGDVNGAPVKITNVKEGDLSETSKDAVNGSQLYATNQNVTNLSNKVAQGFNITADNGTADNVQLGETITYTSSDKNIVTTVSDNKIDFKLSAEAVDKFTVKYFSVNSTVAENRLNDGAKGVNSIAIGPNATSVDQGAIALGTNSNANGNAAAALGVNSKAEGIQATAVGSQANATANGTTAIGRETTASAGEATAVGSNANATSEKATALGVGSKATDKAALAVGTNATASAQSAVAVGTQSVADKQFAVAVGMGAQATLENSVAL